MTTTARQNLWARLARIESDTSLFEPNQLRRRLEVLDELDDSCAEGHPQTSGNNSPALFGRVKSLRARLEAANSTIYRSIRREIRLGATPDCLLRWIEICRTSKGAPRPGLSYDHLDELISGVLRLREPENTPARKPEAVFYQPTPVRHILRLIALARLSPSDVLVDLGSGLGHVAILAAILTSARTIGIESEAAYVHSARSCMRSLNLRRVTFVHSDAREADLSTGTVFYLYTPFTGSILSSMLDRLRHESEQRPLHICSLGPCTLALAREPWLRVKSAADPDRIACFRSRV